MSGGVQRVQVTIRGGYTPSVIQVRQGIPVEIEFDRQETGDCSSRVVFPDLHLSAALPAHQRTTVRFTPQQAGSFLFACGMNMIHGTLVVTPNGQAAPPHEPEQPDTAAPGSARADRAAEPAAAEVEAAQAKERRAEIADLTRRVVIGAVLTTPVFFAVMAQSTVGAHWVPAAVAQPLGAARADHPGHVLRGLADPSHRLARASASQRRHEQPHHPGHASPRSATACWSPLPPVCCRPRCGRSTSKPSG